VVEGRDLRMIREVCVMQTSPLSSSLPVIRAVVNSANLAPRPSGTNFARPSRSRSSSEIVSVSIKLASAKSG
jgi:hypothetical protein